MTKTMTIDEAKQQLAALLAEAAAGQEIILTDGKQLQVRLVPVVTPGKTRIAGLHAGSIVASPDFDSPLSDEFWLGLA